jgi:site-specific recombinase XerD
MVHVLKKSGTTPAAAINKKSIIAAVEARSATPFQAKNFLQTMRQLFAWAAAADHVPLDPTVGVKVHKPKTDGFKEWTTRRSSSTRSAGRSGRASG